MKNLSISSLKFISEITTLIEKEMKKNNIPGLSFALVDEKGVIWSEGFGHTDLSKKEKVTADTLFSTQSMGKCYTATAFLVLATKGLIDLDDPIRKYYPEFNVNTIFGDPDEEIAKITFRRMLSHWASFTHEAPRGNNFDNTPCTFADHIESVNGIWLKSPVGSEQAYSNIGLDLTGYVMGLVVNKSYEEVMKEELFSPLGIKDATYNIQEALKTSFAHGHSGSYKTPDDQIPMLPAGGLYISANELTRFVAFHLRKGKLDEKQIINPSLLEDMYRTQFYESKEFGFGLGIHSSENINGSKSFEHGGGGYGYQSLMKWVPEHNIGVIVLTNDMKHSSIGKIANKALELYISQQTLPESKPIKTELLRRLEGTYKAYRNPLFNVVYENGMLIVFPTSYSEFELYPQSSTDFITKGGKTCKFHLDNEGNPISFYYDNPLLTIVAKYNDGIRDRSGSSKEEWNELLGIYTIQSHGREYYIAITIIEGHLYLINEDCLKLSHYKDNIYFTAEGESLIFEKDKLLYRSISTHKIELNLDKLVSRIKSSKIKYDYFRGAVSTIVNILYATESFETAIKLINQVVEIDKEFKELYSMLGKRTYALGKLSESSKCFKMLLELSEEDENTREMLRKIKLRQ